ncbi:hypothetical protein [Micromonospora sp. NBC_01796]|uniref:hypothetical protein n=1 Tax=Micromonospora sp. NBC_01796 TaxID=2975987 RepID=UPI002DDB66E7|nr:hypothetical protein [Micromonospora sp. NBC_01796]WSA83695.1 hypothetical protein OIE47_25350 [Micromonospora sp. NBC_01796]
MPDVERLTLITTTPWLADLLASLCDLDFSRTEHGPVEPVRLAGGEPLEMFAGDASGGAFLFAGSGGEERPVVYAGSEGEGGLIAIGLADALAAVIELPSLHDALSLPYGTDGGAALRERLDEAEREIREDWPDLDAQRARLRDALHLPPPDGVLERLHAAAADHAYLPVSEHGTYEPMLVTA